MTTYLILLYGVLIIGLCYILLPYLTQYILMNVQKKKYYDFITNLPLFLPVSDIGGVFSKFLDAYPVTPYLDSRESFSKWVHFIHNKINSYLGKPELTYYDALNKYYEHYKLKEIKKNDERKNKEKYIFGTLIIIIILVIIYFYIYI